MMQPVDEKYEPPLRVDSSALQFVFVDVRFENHDSNSMRCGHTKLPVREGEVDYW